MKKYHFITAILIIFQINLSFGQDFAPIGAEWYYSSSAGGAAPTASEYYYLLVEKDTIINDYNLRKIKRTYCNYQGDSIEVSPYFIHQLGDSISMYNREYDKLYKLLVFNASIGDTLLLDIPYENYNSENSRYRVVIDTIITVIYDGIELDKYMLDQPDDFGWFSGFYLEKVGGYEWFLPLGKTIIPEADGPIRCYHDSEIDINFSSRECDYRIVSVNNNLLPGKIELYPNPTSNYLHITSDIKITNIKIFDNSGHFILQTEKNNVDISSLTYGMYLVKIYSGDQIIMKKLIVN